MKVKWEINMENNFNFTTGAQKKDCMYVNVMKCFLLKWIRIETAQLSYKIHKVFVKFVAYIQI